MVQEKSLGGQVSQKRKILILGGGFGGVKAALELANNPNFALTLVSDQPNFRYYPTLYRAATGGSTFASSIPLAEIFAGKSVEIVHDSVQKLDRSSKRVTGKSGKKYTYDELIIALGVVTNFFGIKGLGEHAYGIKTLEEAKRLREHLHKLIVDDRKPDLNYIVIGGGPTGVELAGALPAYLHHVMKRHNIAGKSLHINLVEAESRLLPRMPKSYSQAVAKRLRRLGVKLILGQSVQAETASALWVAGHDIKSHTVVWTAGVTNHRFLKDNDLPLNEHGRAAVDHFLSVGNSLYVIGDNAGTLYSGMAQTALYDGKFVAENLKRQAAGKKMRAYIPKRPIYVTPVGPYWAAVTWGKVRFYGWLGWTIRTLADFIAYHDLEPWWKAQAHWQATFDNEESCPVCLAKK